MQITDVVLACVEVMSFRLQWSVYAELSPVFTLAKRPFLFSRIETKRHTADYTVHAGKLRFKRRGEFFMMSDTREEELINFHQVVLERRAGWEHLFIVCFTRSIHHLNHAT